MTYAAKLRLLCPKHSHPGRRGFACICAALAKAFEIGRKFYAQGRRP